MLLNKYQELARVTAIYPRDKAFEYLALKLAGEAGEVAEKIAKAGMTGITKEIGDCWWYVAMLTWELNIQLSAVAHAGLKPDETMPVNFAAYQAQVELYDRTTNDRMLTLEKMGLLLCGETGRVAELVGKMFRDEGGTMSATRTFQIVAHLSQAMIYLVRITGWFHKTSDEVVSENLRGLADRAARGVLHGSGDNR